MGLFSIFQKPDTLYFPGCMTYFKHKNNFEIYKKVFSKLGIEIISSESLPDEIVCCGLPALEAGYEQEAWKLARKNFQILRENNIKRIITTCPACYKMFTQDYPELLPDWDIQVENVWNLILRKLARKPRLIKHKGEEIVSYHDSCYLGRYCGIYDTPRKIIELLGYIVEEMSDNKENSFCCGSCGGLVIVNSELSGQIAKQRILQAKRKGVRKLIVGSMKNYDLLNNQAEKGLEIEILELSNVLAKALGISISEEIETEEEDIVVDIKSDEKIKGELKEEQLHEEELVREDVL